jgi:ParB family chromosome partitioning protein
MATKKMKRETAMDFLGGLDDMDALPQHLPVSSLMPDPDQPRKHFDQEALDRLAAGIKTDGVLQPLLVRHSGTTPPYIITDGERRWRAAQAVGLDQLPCYIRTDIDAGRIRFVQAMANANRENLSDFELATVIQEHLEANPRLKRKDVAKLLGISASSITRLLALLEPEYVDLAKSGLIESASALSHFKNLDTDSQNKLLEAAQQGETITRDAVEALKSAQAVQAETVETAVMPELEDPGDTGAAVGDSGDTIDVATPRDKPPASGAPANPTVKLSLKIEDIELLIPYFTDKESEKLDIKMSRDTAVGLIENLGQTVPVELVDFPQAIKDGIQNTLTR